MTGLLTAEAEQWKAEAERWKANAVEADDALAEIDALLGPPRGRSRREIVTALRVVLTNDARLADAVGRLVPLDRTPPHAPDAPGYFVPREGWRDVLAALGAHGAVAWMQAQLDAAFMAGIRECAASLAKEAEDPIHKHPGTVKWCADVLAHYLRREAWVNGSPPPLDRFRAGGRR